MRITRRGLYHAVAISMLVLSIPVVWADNVSTVVIVPQTSQAKLGRGDLDNSGAVNLFDLLKVQDVLLGRVVPTYEDVLRGDVNFNGRIDQDDYNKINGKILGTIQLPLATYRAGDTNKDGKVDILDLTMVIDYLLNRSVDIMLYNADCDRNGVIDFRDRDRIQNVILGRTPGCL